MNTKKLVLTALFTALTAVLTYFPKVPLMHGYVHLGDAVIIISALVLGWPAVISASLGSALADLPGYAIYAPATFVIKALMAAALCLLLKNPGVLKLVVAAVIAEIVMVCGYFLYEWALLDIAIALGDAPGNLLQALASASIALFLYPIVKRIKFLWADKT